MPLLYKMEMNLPNYMGNDHNIIKTNTYLKIFYNSTIGLPLLRLDNFTQELCLKLFSTYTIQPSVMHPLDEILLIAVLQNLDYDCYSGMYKLRAGEGVLYPFSGGGDRM